MSKWKDGVESRLNAVESKSRYKVELDSRLNDVESKLRGYQYLIESRTLISNLKNTAEKVNDLSTQLEFQVSRHDELKEQFEMLMDHLGLRIENGPRIVKDK